MKLGESVYVLHLQKILDDFCENLDKILLGNQF